MHRFHFGLRSAATAAVLAALTATPLLAKDKRHAPEVGRAQALQDLARCRTITDDQARLACFDKAAATFDEAEKAGDIVVVDKAQAGEVKRQAFGLNLNGALGIFDRGIHAEKVEFGHPDRGRGASGRLRQVDHLHLRGAGLAPDRQRSAG